MDKRRKIKNIKVTATGLVILATASIILANKAVISNNNHETIKATYETFNNVLETSWSNTTNPTVSTSKGTYKVTTKGIEPTISTTVKKTTATTKKKIQVRTEMAQYNSAPVTEINSNNVNNISAFKTVALDLKNNIIGNNIYTYNYNNKKYSTDGIVEFQFILALLNKEYINSKTLKGLFNNYSVEELERYSTFLKLLNNYTIDKSKCFDFNKYLVDKNLAKYLNNYQNKLLDSNSSDIFDIPNDYFNKSGNYSYGKNKSIDSYMYYFASCTNVGVPGFPKQTEIDKNLYKEVEQLYSSIYSNSKSR